MNEWLTKLGLSGLITPERLATGLGAMATLVVGLVLARLLSGGLGKVTERRFAMHEAMLVRRFSYYLLVILTVASTVHQLGVNLTVLLGAAGVLTVAIGFASQTSASNLISGLFLIAERPFVIGDVVRVGDMTGEVLSVDMLSVKLRTFDNLFVRVPNEDIIKSRITNLTHFPIRRVDLEIGVAYKENLDRVKEILLEIADRNPICLDEPKPLLIFTGFGDSAITYQFSVWGKRENFLELKTGTQEAIKAAFDRHGIEIPFPHRTLYAGSATEPMPVRVVESGREE